MKIMKKFIFLLGFFLPSISFYFLFDGQAYAKEISLYCRGVTSYPSYPEETKEFPLILDDVTGDLYGHPNYVAVGCMDTKNPAKQSCNAENSRIRYSCENDIWITSLELSRVTGNFSLPPSKKRRILRNR
jgi:hypothetical protein